MRHSTQLFALTKASLLEWFRSRAYLAVLGAGAVLALSAPILGELAGGEHLRIFVDFGLLFAGLTSGIGISALAISTVGGEFRSGGMLVLCARSLPRSIIVLSRLLASAIAVLLSNIVLGLLLFGISHWFGSGNSGRILAAAVALSLEGWVLASAALAFSFGSSASVAATGTMLFFILGRFSAAAAEVKGNPILDVVGVFLPRLDRFNLAEYAAEGPLPERYGLVIASGLLWTALFTVIAVVRFRGRDLT
jgi:ABC-type transport system involved in multi-copper enzyme maturation permease subunit